MLDVWDSHLALSAAELIAGRLRLAQLLYPQVSAHYLKLCRTGKPVRLTYQSCLGTDITIEDPPGSQLLQARMMEALARSRPDEVRRGLTLVGPHRDDLALEIGEFPAKGYASHGECWSLALALKLASYEVLKADLEAGGDSEPVLILDDVFAELDEYRRSQLAAAIADAQQVLITAAVVGDLPVELGGARYDVMSSEVTHVR
jgi:DNA replication and repair protein RecF